ncbi:Transcriptional activator spt7 [Ceratobasidium sp. 395]|nr:Transcriptional activator spt7 [Ceratobasidium sp. 395]
MPSHLRKRSVMDESDDDYSSASGKFNGTKVRTNGVVKMDGVVHTNGRVNGVNGVNGRASSTPESDVPTRPLAQRSRGSGHARRPLPEGSFAERAALPRTVESMSQFLSIDKELQLDDGLQRHLDTAGAGPSRLTAGDGFLREEATRRVRSQLRQIRQNDEDILRLDEWREVDDSKAATGGKRKRLVIASSDDEPDDVPHRTKFSTTGLSPDQEEHESNTDLWWEAMRAGNMIGGGVLPMAQHGFPPIKPSTTRRRKKRPKTDKANDARPGLSGTIYKNISTLHNIRRAHSKILILNAAVEDPNSHMPPMDDDEPEAPRPPIPGLTLAEDSGAQCLHRVSSTVLEHAGFEGSSQVSLDVLQHVAADYIMNVGRTFRFMCDKFGHTMSNEQIILHCLSEHGISEVQDLERYVKDDVERYGSRLQDLERKLTQAYIEQTEAAAIEEDGLFDEENEEFAMGGFTEELGEDFFGLRELGLERELGLTSLSIPKRLLRGRRDNAANANSANREPPLPYPPPAPFIPIHTASLDSHIGLLHPYYASRAGGGAPPPPDGGPVGVQLADDPVNALKVKMGPLGQIVAVAPNAGKKKGGGGGGGGGGGSAVASGGPAEVGIKVESVKDPKKKKAKAPAPVSTDPPLTMPTFGVSRAPAVPAPPPEVSTMMPDFSTFMNGGVHAGV